MLSLIVRAREGVHALRSHRRTVTALEYGLLGALIAVVILCAASSLGTKFGAGFGTLGAGPQAVSAAPRSDP